jgi:hypothetical protein
MDDRSKAVLGYAMMMNIYFCLDIWTDERQSQHFMDVVDKLHDK